MENIQVSKSQLAKLLAIENITVQHQAGAKTAWFNVKDRVLTLPVWREMSNDLYDMLVVHEVGHALDTPADDWLGAIEKISAKVNPDKPKAAQTRIKGFMNVIEDARIDKRQKRRFPGSKRNYLAGYKDLIERDFFGTARRDVNSMSFIDRLNIYFKGGVALGIKFTAEEMPMLKAVEAAETFDDVIALTEKIYMWAKEKQDQEQEIKDQHRMADSDGDDDDEFDFEEFDVEESDDETEATDGKGQASSKQSDDSDENGDDQEGGGSEKSDETTDSPNSSKSQDAGAGDTDDDLPESETDRAWEEKQNELVADGDTEYHYVTLPTFNADKIVDDYKLVLDELNKGMSYYKGSYGNRYDAMVAEFIKFKASEAATISFMVKEFEMRKSADEYSRTSVAKTGVIDTNKLHSYKYNDDIFRRVATVATGKNHGFVMFLDWSGSMVYDIKDTVKQLLSLTMFCKRVQVPFEVYSFRTPFEREHIHDAFNHKNGDIMMQPFKLRNLLSSRMKIHELNEAMQNLWMLANGAAGYCEVMNSTPLNQAIVVAPHVVNQFKARNKVQIVNVIVLTDGQSDPCDKIHGLSYLNANKKHKFILQDKISKKNYEFVTGSSRYTYSFNSISGKDKTELFLRMLKDQTGCNLLGFYLHGSNFKRAFEEFNGYTYSNDFYEENKKSWTNDGFIVAKNSGYDEYYILNTNRLKLAEGQLVITQDMTKGKIAKEFMKFSGNKAVNRVLLQRFVKKIAA